MDGDVKARCCGVDCGGNSCNQQVAVRTVDVVVVAEGGERGPALATSVEYE